MRALDNDAAVGLLSLSAASLLRVTFLTGGGGGGGALRDRARDAAVGAKRPEDGVFGLATCWFCAADDLGREGVDGAVLGTGRAWRVVEGFDTTDWPVCWDLRGCETDDWRDVFGGELTKDLADELLPTEERVFLGDATARRVPVVGVDLPVATVFPLDGGGFTGSGDAGVGVVGMSTGGAGSGMGRGLTTGDLDMLEEGELESVGTAGLISADATGLGGHSLFSLASSFAASPAICDETLELLGTTG